MMDEEFEHLFEDELDALADFDSEFEHTTLVKGKKSLDFSTPSNKLKKLPGNQLGSRDTTSTQSTADESFSIKPLNESLGDEDNMVNTETGGQANVKRKRSDQEYGDLSEEEDGGNKENEVQDTLPDIVHQKKKPRITNQSANHSENVEEVTLQPYADDISLMKQQQQRQGGKNKASRVTKQEERLFKNYDFERQRVMCRMPPTEYIPVTDNAGRRYYMTLTDEDDLHEQEQELSGGKTSMQLLSKSIGELKAQLEEERHQRLLQESKELSQFIERPAESIYPDDLSNLSEFIERDTIHEMVKDTPKLLDENLWVERYSPDRYTELLSDEATNRLVLKWLKLWDHVVFGKEKKVIQKETGKNKKKENNKFVTKNQQEFNEELDPHNRPMYKIVLLSGPPGLGKTTLAHVIAKHAGYNVVEINASDDRSADVFKQKLESATQMKAVLGSDPRPNCLIIDEIDGSPVATINVLLALIKQSDTQQTNTKKKKKPQLLQRPVICICNDLYVPALRQLRQNAFVINFPPTISTKLAGRLFEICKRETIKTDLTTLLSLCEKADNDIRSCLNTLQFVQGRGKELSLYTVNSLSVGQKDAHKSLFSTWQHIFKMPKPKRKRYVNPHDHGKHVQTSSELEASLAQNNTSLTSRFEKTYQVAVAAGEHEKIRQGLFENYLLAKVKDPRLNCVSHWPGGLCYETEAYRLQQPHKLVKATEWLGFVDILSKEVMHSQNYTLMPYTMYLPVTFHLLFASNAPHKVQYPHSQFENTTKLQRSENLVTVMLNDVSPSVRKNLNNTVIVTEFLPSLMEIIQPTLRPVNTQLYSAREKEELTHLIQVMIAYNLTYNQERTADGQYIYALDPNMDDLNKYGDQKQRKQLTYAAKQLIAREIELEKMRRTENKEEERKIIAEERQKKFTANKEEKNKNVEKPTEAQLPNYKRQKLEAKEVKEEEKEYVDFFGRKLKRTTPEAKREKKQEEKIGGEIWFKFKEGFSNAVRRTVRVQEFL